MANARRGIFQFFDFPMMRRALFLFAVFLANVPRGTFGAPAAWYRAPLGAASVAADATARAIPERVRVDFSGAAPFHSLTVCYWLASSAPNGALPAVSYIPKWERAAADLLAGAGGWSGAPVSFSAPLVADVGFPAAGPFPRAPLVVNWTNTTHDLTFTAGGKSATLPAGSGAINFEPGGDDGLISISGGGVGCVGVGYAPVNRLFSSGSGMLRSSEDSAEIGAGWVFVVHRITLNAVEHKSRLDVYLSGGIRSDEQAHEMPPNGVDCFSSDTWLTIWEFCVGALGVSYLWDLRIFAAPLDDDEIAAIHDDGARHLPALPGGGNSGQ